MCTIQNCLRASDALSTLPTQQASMTCLGVSCKPLQSTECVKELIVLNKALQHSIQKSGGNLNEPCHSERQCMKIEAVKSSTTLSKHAYKYVKDAHVRIQFMN